jgi:hypothetical protein
MTGPAVQTQADEQVSPDVHASPSSHDALGAQSSGAVAGLLAPPLQGMWAAPHAPPFGSRP